MREGLPAIHALARQLLAQETAADESEEIASAVIRVWQRFFACMGRLIGPIGFHALISRALSRASASHPFLKPVRVDMQGGFSLDGFAESAGGCEAEELQAAGEALIAEFLGLVVRFLGTDLALQLVQQCWPDLPVALSDTSGEKGDA